METEKKRGKSKKKMETDKTCAMSQIKTYVKIIQVTNPLDLHTSLNSGPMPFGDSLYHCESTTLLP